MISNNFLGQVKQRIISSNSPCKSLRPNLSISNPSISPFRLLVSLIIIAWANKAASNRDGDIKRLNLMFILYSTQLLICVFCSLGSNLRQDGLVTDPWLHSRNFWGMPKQIYTVIKKTTYKSASLKSYFLIDTLHLHTLYCRVVSVILSYVRVADENFPVSQSEIRETSASKYTHLYLKGSNYLQAIRCDVFIIILSNRHCTVYLLYLTVNFYCLDYCSNVCLPDEFVQFKLWWNGNTPTFCWLAASGLPQLLFRPAGLNPKPQNSYCSAPMLPTR